MHIAAIQLNATDDIAANMCQVEEYIVSAVAQQARLVFLPECFAFMQNSRAQLRESAESDGQGQIQDFLSRVSNQYDVWIFAGSLPMKTEDPKRITNTMLVYDDSGARVARYDKIHLFDIVLSEDEKYLESAYTQPGSEISVIDSPAGKIGLSICYDMRFPEMYRKLADMGADIFIAPSAFSTHTGPSHWLPLLTARAIENTCYMIAPAQTGVHPRGRKTYGHSVIIDPWGQILALEPEKCGPLVVEINLTDLEKIRQQMPSFNHRRLELY